MLRRIVILAVVAFASVVAGCGGDEESPFVGSWTQTQPSGATFLWVIEEIDAGYGAWVYTDQAECATTSPTGASTSPRWSMR